MSSCDVRGLSTDPPIIPRNHNNIKKLSDTVIDKIAAGEVIQRPCNAVKEMLENSVDSGATTINLTIKEGGLKLIKIADNGSGVDILDMPILCERFTTSKISQLGDLLNLDTLGFRGEALSSVSQVAHVYVVSRTANAQSAYRGEYLEGKLVGNVKICAGNVGTTILVQDLFFNVPTRLRILKNSAEEFGRIYSFVSKYAILHSEISICLRKNDEIMLQTPGKCSVRDNIGLVYGANIMKDIVPVSGGIPANEESPISETKFTFSGYFANTSYSGRKNTKIFFVNSRLVEIPKLKRLIDDFYAPLLTKKSSPFVYCSIDISRHCVDVNVHPCKENVHFLFEEEIVDLIKRTMEKELVLSENATSRLFFTQKPPKIFISPAANRSFSANSQIFDRSDCRSTKLDAYVHRRNSIPPPQMFNKIESTGDSPPNSIMGVLFSPEKTNIRSPSKMCALSEERRDRVDEPSSAELSSVLELQDEFKSQREKDLNDVLSSCTFVGSVNERYSLIQHKETLVMLETRILSRNLFYQLVLTHFGKFETYHLPSPPTITELLTDGELSDAEEISQLISEKSAMLLDYFSMEVNEGKVLTLPVLVTSYKPPMRHMPQFVRKLAREVDWQDEKNCFDSIANAFADFYAIAEPGDYDLENGQPFDLQHCVEFCLLPCFRNMLVVGGSQMRSAFTMLTQLTDLYKQFERC